MSFAYPGGPDVLSNVDLVVPRGSVTALVGPSGAGKTTLANLLPRFMDVTGGRIAIDGVDVRDVTLASLRGAMALVTQDVVLFDDTVRRNVAYGLADVPEERIRAALAAANAEEFVDALPKGLDTPVGEAGGRLSGGQRQRLAIARALLKDPPILILDEATSALDTESERAVQDALERLMAGRTTLVIAHRLSTVRRADQIVVLERGRLVERGRHAELLALGGVYRRLHDLAAFEEEKTHVKSMTGFGRAQAALPDGTQISITVRGVNHRFLDLSLKMRDDLGALEAPLRKLVSSAVARGHVDLSVRVVAGRREARSRSTARRRGATPRSGGGSRRRTRSRASCRRATCSRCRASSASARTRRASRSGPRSSRRRASALDDFDASRRREGEATAAALGVILDRLESGIARVDEAREGLAERLLAQLRERVAKLAAGIPLDEARLAQEVALLADRADITEEIDRFRAHLVEARRLMEGEPAAGKRLDVLAQELHREANTSSQKARELPLTRVLLDLKSDVEALKEQIQNVE